MRAGGLGWGWRWEGATRLHIGNKIGIRGGEFAIKKEFVK
jgi:hypothetical protein